MTQPVLQLGTFGDVGPPPQQTLQLGTTNVPPAPTPSQAAPVNYGATPVGTIALTPPQATRASLNNAEERKDVTVDEGRVARTAEQQQADLYARDAAQKQQQAADYKKFLDDALEEHAADKALVERAHNDYAKAAGNLKDPSKEFWADRTTGSRILSGLAAFASGMGAGLLGQTGNPYLEHLNKMVDANYQAHKQNIEDLYQKQVAAGKIADTDESHREFFSQAKLKSYELGELEIQSKLKQVTHNALGENYRVLADKTNNDITEQQINRRAAEGQREAQAAAAAAAMMRAKQKEIADKYQDAYKANLAKDMPAEQARAEAAKLMQGSGYDRSLLAPIMEANGGQYNPQSGQFEFQETPKPADQDEVPTVDPGTGRMLKPEDREKLKQLKVEVNGVARFANNPDDQRKAQQEITAHQAVTEFMGKLSGPEGWLAKLRNGTLTSKDVGEWEGARKASIESYKALSGAEGNTGVGTAKLLGEDEFPEPPGLISNTLTSTVTGGKVSAFNLRGPQVDKYEGQVANMARVAERTQQNIERRLRPGPAGKPAEATETAPAGGSDFFKKFGGK